MTKLTVIAFDFKIDVTPETEVYKRSLIRVIGDEEKTIEYLKKREAIFKRLGEWPSKNATSDDKATIELIESAEYIAWWITFKGWLKMPGDHGEHFEYFFE